MGTLSFFPIKEAYFSTGSLLGISRCAIRGYMKGGQVEIWLVSCIDATKFFSVTHLTTRAM